MGESAKALTRSKDMGEWVRDCQQARKLATSGCSSETTEELVQKPEGSCWFFSCCLCACSVKHVAVMGSLWVSRSGGHSGEGLDAVHRAEPGQTESWPHLSLSPLWTFKKWATLTWNHSGKAILGTVDRSTTRLTIGTVSHGGRSFVSTQWLVGFVSSSCEIAGPWQSLYTQAAGHPEQRLPQSRWGEEVSNPSSFQFPSLFRRRQH